MLIQEKTIWTPDNSFLLEYHARIECGEMLVGQELWQELQNLKEDFQNDAFYYDTKDTINNCFNKGVDYRLVHSNQDCIYWNDKFLCHDAWNDRKFENGVYYSYF